MMDDLPRDDLSSFRVYLAPDLAHIVEEMEVSIYTCTCPPMHMHMRMALPEEMHWGCREHGHGARGAAHGAH